MLFKQLTSPPVHTPPTPPPTPDLDTSYPLLATKLVFLAFPYIFSIKSPKTSLAYYIYTGYKVSIGLALPHNPLLPQKCLRLPQK